MSCKVCGKSLIMKNIESLLSCSDQSKAYHKQAESLIDAILSNPCEYIRERMRMELQTVLRTQISTLSDRLTPFGGTVDR